MTENMVERVAADARKAYRAELTMPPDRDESDRDRAWIAAARAAMKAMRKPTPEDAECWPCPICGSLTNRQIMAALDEKEPTDG